MELKRCKKCTLPITWETLYFDDEGVCNVCKNWDIKKKDVNWEEREKTLIGIFNDAKTKNKLYDCIVPFSGGKDSTYILFLIVKKYGLKPLVISFDHGFYRPRTIENRIRTFRRLGVDVITLTPNWRIVKKLMYESLFRKGDFCWHCHAGVAAYPMQMAIKLNVPLVVWGEGGGEYEGYFKFEELEESNEWKYNRRGCIGLRAEDLAGFIGVELRDMSPYIYPSQEELDRAGVKSIPLGHYMPWDQKKHAEIIKKELGWQEDEVESLPGLSFDKVECMFEGIRDYIKFIKRGFARMTHRTTIDIKDGRLTRDAAMKLVRKYDGRKPKSLETFLKYLDMTEAEFHEMCFSHVIAPNQRIDVSSLPEGPKLWDQDLWLKEY